MAEELICIRRTSTTEEADIIVAWLEERGVQASVSDRGNPGVLAFGASDLEGIAICVTDEAIAKDARKLLAEHDRERAAGEETAAGTKVELRCEECGQTATFSIAARELVRECPNCGAFIDTDPDIA